MKNWAPTAVTVSVLNAGIDADLDLGAVHSLKVDHIEESTGAHGIVHDDKITADHIGETTGAHGIALDNATTAHHQLTGLTDDDHERYFDKDTSKQLTGVILARNVDNSYLNIFGGTANINKNPVYQTSGGNRDDRPGCHDFYVPNAALDGFNMLLSLRGKTDTPFLDINSYNIKNSPNVAMTGVIWLWSGAIVSIPAGWILCDGGAGTPNLRDRFVVGAGTTYAVGATGGEVTHALSIAELAAHTHTVDYGNVASYAGTSVQHPIGANTRASGSTGSGTAHENRPPYYALAYIMKT